MGFWNKIFGGKVFEDKRAPTMVCTMQLCGAEYILSEFDMNFDREDSSAEYIAAYAVFEEPINSSVESWITNSSRKESGNVRFYRNSDAMNEGALLEILFKDAACTRFRCRLIDGKELTTVTMAIPRITIAGEEL